MLIIYRACILDNNSKMFLSIYKDFKLNHFKIHILDHDINKFIKWLLVYCFYI